MAIQPQTGTPYTPPHPMRVAGGGERKNQPPFTRPAKATKPAPVPVNHFDPRNPATWGAGLGSSQLSDIVKTQIQDAINPQVTGMRHDQSAYDQQQLGYQNSLTGYYKALAGILQGEAPAVSSAYNSAAGTIGQIGQGLTGAAGQQMQAQNAADQAILARGGQTQAADYMAAKANPGSSALNPFYSEHGAIPGTSLATQGAAKAAEAALQPGVWAAHGRDALTEAISKAVAGDKAYEQKIQDIYTQVPALRDKILTQVQDFETQQRQLKDTEISLGIKSQATQADTQTKLQTLKLRQQTLTANIEKWNAQLQNSALDRNTRLQIAAQSRAAAKELVKLRGQVSVQTAIEKKKAGVGAKEKVGTNPEYPNLTKTQVLHLRAGISAAFNGVPEQRDANNKVVAQALPPVDYQTAIDHAIAAGYSRAGATRMANRFYMPGQRGRPAKPNPDTGFRGANLTP